MPLTRIYLVRHADVENPGKVLYGHLDNFPLSAKGREQARLVGVRLRDAGLRRIVHSPLQRAHETAEIICAQLPQPVPLIPEPELREAEFGRYLQGVPPWQVPIRRPLWFVHKARRGLLPGDESVATMGGRVLAVARQQAVKYPEEATACVSHADPLQAAWILLDGRAHSEFEMYRKNVLRAGVLEVDFDGERVAAVKYVPPPDVRLPGSPEPKAPLPS